MANMNIHIIVCLFCISWFCSWEGEGLSLSLVRLVNLHACVHTQTWQAKVKHVGHRTK
jgi:hypothetical protein